MNRKAGNKVGTINVEEEDTTDKEIKYKMKMMKMVKIPITMTTLKVNYQITF